MQMFTYVALPSKRSGISTSRSPSSAKYSNPFQKPQFPFLKYTTLYSAQLDETEVLLQLPVVTLDVVSYTKMMSYTKHE